jgi:hypothetical protein
MVSTAPAPASSATRLNPPSKSRQSQPVGYAPDGANPPYARSQFALVGEGGGTIGERAFHVYWVLFSKAPLALLKGSQRPQKIDASKGWPIHVGEIKLAEDALPQQESRQPYLAAGADN